MYTCSVWVLLHRLLSSSLLPSHLLAPNIISCLLSCYGLCRCPCELHPRPGAVFFANFNSTLAACYFVVFHVSFLLASRNRFMIARQWGKLLFTASDFYEFIGRFQLTFRRRCSLLFRVNCRMEFLWFYKLANKTSSRAMQFQELLLLPQLPRRKFPLLLLHVTLFLRSFAFPAKSGDEILLQFRFYYADR